MRAKVLDADVWVCPSEPCRGRQLAHAMVTTVKGRPRQDNPGGNRHCRFVPLPRQVEAIEAVAGPPTFILIGGAAGGSKSRGVREIAHTRCMTVPHYRVLLLRRTYAQLEENHLRDVELEAPEMSAQFVPSAKLVRYPNGSTLRFGHCETVADAANYLSSEYDLIIFDELVTFEETQFLLIASRARSTKPGLTPKVLAGTNPGGPQSHWVRMRFMDKTVDRDQFPDYRPEEWHFIPSKLEDNPYLDAGYERKLLALPPELRKAYRDGDWDIFPGQYFPEWRRKTHISHDTIGNPVHLVYPVDLPRVLAMDWGYVKAGWVGWFVLLSDGGAYLEDEYVPVRVKSFDQGKEIARRTKERGLTRIKLLVYDHQMETPQTDTGEPIIETVRRGMKAGGLSVGTKQADKDRTNGWPRMREWLALSPAGHPWLTVSKACPYTIRTVPAQVSDPNNPEDLDTDGEDHACDAIRYFVMSRPALGVFVKKESLAEWSYGWLKQQGQKPAGVLSRREAHVA